MSISFFQIVSLAAERLVVIMKIFISKHLSVLQGLSFEDLRIILTGDVHPPGFGSYERELDHGRHERGPDIQGLHQLGSPLGHLHGFLRRLVCNRSNTGHKLTNLALILPKFLPDLLVVLQVLPLQGTLGTLAQEKPGLQQLLTSELSGPREKLVILDPVAD